MCRNRRSLAPAGGYRRYTPSTTSPLGRLARGVGTGLPHSSIAGWSLWLSPTDQRQASRRDRASALACSLPGRWSTWNLKSWRARNHLVTALHAPTWCSMKSTPAMLGPSASCIGLPRILSEKRTVLLPLLHSGQRSSRPIQTLNDCGSLKPTPASWVLVQSTVSRLSPTTVALSADQRGTTS